MGWGCGGNHVTVLGVGVGVGDMKAAAAVGCGCRCFVLDKVFLRFYHAGQRKRVRDRDRNRNRDLEARQEKSSLKSTVSIYIPNFRSGSTPSILYPLSCIQYPVSYTLQSSFPSALHPPPYYINNRP